MKNENGANQKYIGYIYNIIYRLLPVQMAISMGIGRNGREWAEDIALFEVGIFARIKPCLRYKIPQTLTTVVSLAIEIYSRFPGFSIE